MGFSLRLTEEGRRGRGAASAASAVVSGECWYWTSSVSMMASPVLLPCGLGDRGRRRRRGWGRMVAGFVLCLLCLRLWAAVWCVVWCVGVGVV